MTSMQSIYLVFLFLCNKNEFLEAENWKSSICLQAHNQICFFVACNSETIYIKHKLKILNFTKKETAHSPP
jgi:hypothetical protein